MASGAPVYPTTALYVGDLDPSVTEQDLMQTFREIGPVGHVRVLRDSVTQQSLCYAYVNYQNQDDAIRALDTLNFAPVKGRAVRIMWSQRDPTVRRSGIGNVFIKYLDPSVDNKALFDTFSQFGNILSCKVVCNSKGQSLGYGYVHFESQEAAEKAITKVNGMSILDKTVFVGPFINRRDRAPGSTTDPQSSNLYVKEFGPSMTDEELKKLFEPFGPIASAVVMKNEDGSSRGFGFVSFHNPEDAMRALSEMNGKEINSKHLFCARAQKKRERLAELRSQKRPSGVNLYVKHLDDDVDDDHLRSMFKEFGTITSAKVMRDEKGMPRGFGFVCFSAQEEAERALREMNRNVRVGHKPLYVTWALRKDERRQQVAARYQTSMFRASMQQPSPTMFPGPYPLYPAPPMTQAQQGYMYSTAPYWGRRWPAMAPGQNGQAGFYGQYPGPHVMNARRPRMPRAGGPGGMYMQGGIGKDGQPMSMPSGPAGAMPGMRKGPRPGRGPYPGAPAGARPVESGVAAGSLDVTSSQVPFDASTLASMPEDRQKQILGTVLFQRVSVLQPQYASKITGMILGAPTSELLSMVENPSQLDSAVAEAAGSWEEHQRKQAESGMVSQGDNGMGTMDGPAGEESLETGSSE